MGGIAGNDKPVGRVITVVGRDAIYEMGLTEGKPGASVPGLCAGTAGLMALHAIHREIGACAERQTPRVVSGGGKRRQGLRRGDNRIQISGLAEERKLIARERVHIGNLVQFACVPAQYMAGYRCM